MLQKKSKNFVTVASSFLGAHVSRAPHFPSVYAFPNVGLYENMPWHSTVALFYFSHLLLIATAISEKRQNLHQIGVKTSNAAK